MIAKPKNRQTDGPVTKLKTHLVGRLVCGIGYRPKRALMVAWAVVVSAGTGYAIVGSAVSAWVWLPLSLAALALGTALLWPGSKASPGVPARSIIQEANLYGMKAIVGSSGEEVFRVSFGAVPLGRDIAGFIVLDSNDAPAINNLKSTLAELFSESASLQEAETNFLRVLDAQCDIEYAFVGLWDKSRHVLAYFALGFEAPTVINVGWPHRAEVAIDRKTKRGPKRISFGVHPLSRGERWLFYTPPLVAVPDPHRQPFNSVGLVQYAYDSCMMPNDLWMDYLLELGFHAHNEALPPGSLLVSLACEESADTRLHPSDRASGLTDCQPMGTVESRRRPLRLRTNRSISAAAT